MKLSGRFDEFKVTCDNCTETITAEDNDGLFGGKQLTCTGCGAEATASNDGGIWKLYETNTDLSITVDT